MVLVGNGSEVGTLLAAAALLKERGVKSQIVSAPSIGVFMNQDKAYRDQVIPSNLKAFGLTAGLPSTLMRLIPNGKVYGLDHFGASAPYGILDEKFGFMPENIASEIEKWVKS